MKDEVSSRNSDDDESFTSSSYIGHSSASKQRGRPQGEIRHDSLFLNGPAAGLFSIPPSSAASSFSSFGDVSPTRSMRRQGDAVPSLPNTTALDTDDTSKSPIRPRQSSLRNSSRAPIMTLSQMLTTDADTPFVSWPIGKALQTVFSSDYSTKSDSRTEVQGLPSGVAEGGTDLSEGQKCLGQHIYEEALLAGRFSDIDIIAFGKTYKLHKLMLVRCRYFEALFSEPWAEANQRSVTLNPDEFDPNISRFSFELALRRIYGFGDLAFEQMEAPAVLACARWLNIDDMADGAIEIMRESLNNVNVSAVISILEGNYYGQGADEILNSAKVRLCSDGRLMPIEKWLVIPSETILEVVGSDAFWIQSEMERLKLAESILKCKLKALVDHLDLPQTYFVLDDSLFKNQACRPCPQASQTLPQTGRTPTLSDFQRLYAHESISPLLELIDKRIHYCHMTTKQLSQVRQMRDVCGFHLVQERSFAEALWMTWALQKRIEAVKRGEAILGLTSMGGTTSFTLPESMDSQSVPVIHDGTYWVPSADMSIFIRTSGELETHRNRMDERDSTSSVTTCKDDTAECCSKSSQTPRSLQEWPPGNLPRSLRSHIPPFRFGAQFPRLRKLPFESRIYSTPQFYAGSYWALHVIRSRDGATSHDPRLGVYVSRVNPNEEFQDDGSLVNRHGLVGERIRHLETRLQMRQRGSTNHESDADLSRHEHGTHPNYGRPKARSRSQSAPTIRSDGHAIEHDEVLIPIERMADPYGCADYRQFANAYFKISITSSTGKMLYHFESPPQIFENGGKSWGMKVQESCVKDDGTRYTPEESDEMDEQWNENMDERLRIMITLGVI